MQSEVSVGDVIAGKYRIETMLGRGGMGVVFSAFRDDLRQRVALKFLNESVAEVPEAVARFLREARLAVQIQSEHVARVLDVGTLDSGAPYMVMEYLAGQDLREICSVGPLQPQVAVNYLLQACDAVAEAHALGIVHRDLKPANLFLTQRRDGTPLVKVLDFGISKTTSASGESSVSMTTSTAIMGSPQYMSPEQIRSSRDVDARSDIWSLGAILHELLAGAPAYTSETTPSLLAKIIADPPTLMSDAQPGLSPKLQLIVSQCLEKDLSKRFASVSDLAEQLKPFASEEVAALAARIARLMDDGSTVRRVSPSISKASPKPGNATSSHSSHRSDNAQQPAYSEGSSPIAKDALGSWSNTGSRPDSPAQRSWRAPLLVLSLLLGSAGVIGWFEVSKSSPKAAKGSANATQGASDTPPSASKTPSVTLPNPGPIVRPIRAHSVEKSALAAPPFTDESSSLKPKNSTPPLGSRQKHRSPPRKTNNAQIDATPRATPSKLQSKSKRHQSLPPVSPSKAGLAPRVTRPTNKSDSLRLFDDTK